ncbi:MAG TPA: endonuclease MutS2 [Thermodesulfovibrionales bacterium]|nr:endonuclease MutS2 [Thermodesulfovibrionales bacterium]
MIPESSLHLLEFHKLLRIVSGFSNSEASHKAVLDIHPLGAKGEIDERLGRIDEIRRLADEGDPLRLSHFSDISVFLSRIRPDGAVIEGAALALFIPFLEIIAAVVSQVRERQDLPFLADLTQGLAGFPDILRVLTRSLDSEGAILDSASPALSELRTRVRRLQSRITKRLEEMMRDESVSVFLQDSFITERSGRLVIPVRMDSKGQIPGVVHDVSRSGETAFIEPLPIIGLSNELENLLAEQKAEEIRILRNICAAIRAVTEKIEAEHEIIVHLDLLNCIASFADRLSMNSPQVNESGVLTVMGARHPLLTLALQKAATGQEVVPLDVTLGGDRTVMVITGSNAGGKTIAIKTIGLLTLMALSGMPVPADSSSEFPLLQSILVDIGDEQSIENSLSTFSAHMANISEILKRADTKSLILIDELGTGTDPDEGAALACAVLKEIGKRGALLFSTTHLTDIKGFVHRTEGMVNASMDFDQTSLTPLYRLRIGEPGQSHAIEIARKYGLPESIIDSAKAMLGGIKVDFDNLIADLNAKRAEYERALGEIAREKLELEGRRRTLAERLSEAERSGKDALAAAHAEASAVIAATKREMNALLEEMKKTEKEKRREVLKRAELEHKKTLEKLKEYKGAPGESASLEELKTGDIVFVGSLGYDASVIEVDRKHATLRVGSGSIEIEVPVSDVALTKGKISGKTPLPSLQSADEVVQSRISLIGLRVDEALSRLEPFLNHASLAGLQEVTIIHGFGTGALSRAVKEHLTGHPLVKSFRKGEQAEGGGGVTIATFR